MHKSIRDQLFAVQNDEYESYWNMAYIASLPVAKRLLDWYDARFDEENQPRTSTAMPQKRQASTTCG